MKKGARKIDFNTDALKPLLIVLVAAVASVSLIAYGVKNRQDADYTQMNVRSQDEISAEVNNLYSEIENIRREKNALSVQDDKYAELARELTSKESRRSNVEAELYDVQSGLYKDMKHETERSTMPFIACGAAVAVLGIALAIFVAMPKKAKILSQEVIEDKKAKASAGDK
ncbi:MAG: hypothetical protein Q4E47_02745 [Candidatus Saccharibacteria bacterium]|nr:hypothetical protein [Candidatus Saccharibacteria bacterium]